MDGTHDMSTLAAHLAGGFGNVGPITQARYRYAVQAAPAEPAVIRIRGGNAGTGFVFHDLPGFKNARSPR